MPLIEFDFDTAALPRIGDNEPDSGGMRTTDTTNETVLSAFNQNSLTAGATAGRTMLGTQYAKTPLGHPIPWWLGLIVLLVALKFFAERTSQEAEFKGIKIGFYNIMVITLSAIIGLTLTKWVFGVYSVPGLTTIVETA